MKQILMRTGRQHSDEKEKQLPQLLPLLKTDTCNTHPNTIPSSFTCTLVCPRRYSESILLLRYISCSLSSRCIMHCKYRPQTSEQLLQSHANITEI